MVNNILTAAGIPYRRGRFVGAKPSTYAVYTDAVSSDGADHTAFPRVVTHAITVELYEDGPDDAAEAAIERAITEAGLPWEKQDRYWLQSEQQYQVIYEFDYTEKVRA
jgi:hypothetical protein